MSDVSVDVIFVALWLLFVIILCQYAL